MEYLAAVLLASALASTPALADGQTCLAEFESKVERDYPGVGSIVPQQVEDLLADDASILLLDVRDKSEYDVGHIPGAVHVDPDVDVTQFLAEFGNRLKDRTVLVYCSVGVRSSRLGQRLADPAREMGARGVYNLKGGIFAWHNYGIALAAAAGRTELVHPYSRSWSRYLDFPNYSSYVPKPAPRSPR
jgi:rhodanese-related sulfurtransferase